MRKVDYPFLFYLFLSCLFVVSATAQVKQTLAPFKVYPGIYNAYTEANCYVFPDRKRELGYEAGLKHWQQGDFVPLKDYKKPGKFARGGYNFWIYLELENPNPDSMFLLFKVLQDTAWVNGISTVRETFKPAKDPFGILNSGVDDAFYYTIAPYKKDSLLFKINWYNLHENFAPRISDLKTFEQKLLQNKGRLILIYGISFGCFVILFLLAMLLYLQNKDKAFLWYAVYLFSIMFIAWRNFELLYTPFYSSLYILKWRTTKFAQNVLLFIAYVQFVRYFVGVRQQDLKLDNLLKTFNKVFLIALPVELLLQVLSMHWSYVFYWWFRAAGVLFSFALLFWLGRLKSPMVKFVIAGSLCLLIWDVISWAFPADITSDVSMIGVMLDVFCFSTGLAVRERMLRDNHDRLQKNLIEEMQRTQQLQLEKEQTLTHERDRIASEMHDDLGSGLTTLRFLSLTAIENEADAGKKTRITKIAEKASDIMENMADIIWAMNSRNDTLDNFCYYMRGYAADFLEDHKIKSRIRIPDDIPFVKLDGSKRRNLLLAVKEILNNVVKHAKTSEVEIVIRFDEQLHISIKDNGIGFSGEQNGEKIFGGNGLKNISKRITEIHGSVHFVQNHGTEVCIAVPLGKSDT
ncbi:MAG TPA: 7TM diverse intracellular signaling domain-containing protein [Saprospiraceae bacterium]|nr:7TM diverse intracellular signaling domain-containing protein [Saprospiraceae bacterium]